MFKRDAESVFHARPRSIKRTKYALLLSTLVLVATMPASTQTPKPPVTPQEFSDISGMYSFEREGEFVQVTVERRPAKADNTKPLAVTGYISRYADTDSD